MGHFDADERIKLNCILKKQIVRRRLDSASLGWGLVRGYFEHGNERMGSEKGHGIYRDAEQM